MTEVVDLVHASELDEFVKHHPNCHFMQTSIWGRVKSDWSWYGIICRDAKRNILGTMALLCRELKWKNSVMLYAPRGPIFDHNDIRTFLKLVAAAKQLAYRLNAAVLRLDPMVQEENMKFCRAAAQQGFEQSIATDYSQFQPRMCYVMDLRNLTPETLAQAYHRSTRYHYHLALRNNLRVERSNNINAFCELMQKTALHNGFSPKNAEYFDRFLHQMRNYARLYLVKKDEKIIAGAIAVFLGERAWYMYGASDPEDRKSHPNELLQWHMQRDAILKGCKFFDLRGVEGYPLSGNPKIGLHQFKQGFSAQFVAYAGQFDYVCRPVLWFVTQLYSKIRQKRAHPR